MPFSFSKRYPLSCSRNRCGKLIVLLIKVELETLKNSIIGIKSVGYPFMRFSVPGYWG